MRSSVTRPRIVIDRYVFPFVVFALFTVACLIFSDDILGSAKPLFPGIDVGGIPRTAAIPIVLGLDLLGAAWLTAKSGGSQFSPFAPLLFLFPTVSILLREPPRHFLLYAVGAACLFVLTATDTRRYSAFSNETGAKRAFLIVSLGCLGLTTLVGFVTLPR